jgi:hypothetical protein
MKKFYCRDCKSLIDEECVIWRETCSDEDGHYTDGFKGEYAVCPYCGGTDIEDAVQCTVCGEWHNEEELTVGLCSKCEKDVQEKVNEFFKQFSVAQIECIFESGMLEKV